MATRRKKPTEHTVVYSERPQVKQRPRMTRRGKAYTPIKTHLAENIIGEKWDGPKFEGPIYLKATFSKEGSVITIGVFTPTPEKITLRGDIDNYVKLVMDGLNGIAYEDDNQIVYIEVTKQ